MVTYGGSDRFTINPNALVKVSECSALQSNMSLSAVYVQVTTFMPEHVMICSALLLAFSLTIGCQISCVSL